MKARIASVAVACLVALPLGAEPRRSRQSVKLHDLVEGKRFEPIATVASLPEPVRAELARLMRQDVLSMADPTQKFQATDDISDRTLPGRRLILAGRAGDLVVVHYETGGYAHLYKLVLFRTSADSASVVLASHVKGAIPDLASVARAALVDFANDSFPY